MKVLKWKKKKKLNVRQLMARYDVIGINEVKTEEPVHFRGYVTLEAWLHNRVTEQTVVLMRNCIVPFVHKVDTNVSDQVWLQFRNISGVLFGFTYIPPSDSQYYSYESFAAIQEKSSQNICLMVTS